MKKKLVCILFGMVQLVGAFADAGNPRADYVANRSVLKTYPLPPYRGTGGRLNDRDAWIGANTRTGSARSEGETSVEAGGAR